MKAFFFISEDDYVKATKLASYIPKQIVFLFTIGACLLIGMYFFSQPPLNVIALATLIGSLISAQFARHVLLPLLSRHRYRSNKQIRFGLAISLTDDGISYSSEHSTGKIPWDCILKWRENDDYILVYVMTNLYYVVPKSIRLQGFDVDELRSALLAKVGKPK